MIVCLLVIPGLHAQEEGAGETTWESVIDWSRGILELTAERSIDRSGANAPAAAHLAERQIARELPGAVVQGLLPVRVDSRTTLGDLIREDPSLYGSVEALSAEVERRVTRPDPALRRLEVSYELPLFPHLPELLGGAEGVLPLRRPLGWTPTTEYTGIVIYAAEPLRVHGTDLVSRPVPALRPEIYNEAMETVLSEEQVDGEWFLRWGTAAYAEELELADYVPRIGEKPKRILARRLFGVTPTDLVISNRDAREILATPANRRLLREGRILIVTGSGMTEGTSTSEIADTD